MPPPTQSGSPASNKATKGSGSSSKQTNTQRNGASDQATPPRSRTDLSNNNALNESVPSSNSPTPAVPPTAPTNGGFHLTRAQNAGDNSSTHTHQTPLQRWQSETGPQGPWHMGGRSGSNNPQPSAAGTQPIIGYPPTIVEGTESLNTSQVNHSPNASLALVQGQVNAVNGDGSGSDRVATEDSTEDVEGIE